jgi:hypothetical protein
MSANGYQIPVKFARSLAHIIMLLSFSVPPFSRFPRLIATISNLLEIIGHRLSVNATQSLKLCKLKQWIGIDMIVIYIIKL